MLSLESKRWRALGPTGSSPQYARSGHVIYGRDGALFAAGFDLETLALTTDPVEVIDGVVTKSTGAVEFALSHDGSLLYVAGPPVRPRERRLIWVGRDGTVSPLPAEHREYIYPRIALDGARLAVRANNSYENNDIWLWDFERATMTLFNALGDNNYPVWSADSKSIFFDSSRDGINEVYRWNADGTGSEARLTTDDVSHRPTALLANGSLLFHAGGTNGLDTGVLGPDGQVVWILSTSSNELNAEISPGGRWLAYQSDESGRFEVYVRPFPNAEGGRWQISRDGGTKPLWAPSGRELFYVSPDGALISARVETEKEFKVGPDEVVFDGAFYSNHVGRTYDVAPDGQRFLMIQEMDDGDESSVAELILVQNWFEELKRLVPTDN